MSPTLLAANAFSMVDLPFPFLPQREVRSLLVGEEVAKQSADVLTRAVVVSADTLFTVNRDRARARRPR